MTIDFCKSCATVGLYCIVPGILLDNCLLDGKASFSTQCAIDALVAGVTLTGVIAGVVTAIVCRHRWVGMISAMSSPWKKGAASVGVLALGVVGVGSMVLNGWMVLGSLNDLYGELQRLKKIQSS